MALVTAQKRQALRLPTVDTSVDSLDQLALLGLFQVETTAPALSTNQKRWILRLPIVDAAVDELDAWGFLQLPQTGGGGNTVFTFSLSWNIDPTFSISESLEANDGAISVTLAGFGVGFFGNRDIQIISSEQFVRLYDKVHRSTPLIGGSYLSTRMGSVDHAASIVDVNPALAGIGGERHRGAPITDTAVNVDMAGNIFIKVRFSGE